MEKKEELIKIIRNSHISADDKNEWEILVNSVSDDFVDDLLEVLSKFPGEVGWFNDIYKRKKEAFAMMGNNKEGANALLQDIFTEGIRGKYLK